jgi:hypothetical protein
MSRSERTQEMLAHVAAWKNRGKSRKTYCAEHGLNLHTMAYWCAKVRSPHFLASVRRVKAERAGRPVTCEQAASDELMPVCDRYYTLIPSGAR